MICLSPGAVGMVFGRRCYSQDASVPPSGVSNYQIAAGLQVDIEATLSPVRRVRNNQ